jgi:uncharacterized oxidoreductase
MKNTAKNTVLITGGSAGIGFEIAKLLSEKGNHVIITGRDEDRLNKAAAQLKNVTAIQCDISKEKDMDELIERVKKDFPQMNILINNAGRAIAYKLLDENANAYDKAKEEMQTNYFAVVRLIEKLLPQLKKQAESAIVNVSSVVAYVPGRIATYSATKAALHNYTQSLRMQLEEISNVKVFELMPPLVNTELSKDIGGANGIHPSEVAEGLFKGLEKDEYEIHVGMTEDFYKLYLSSPAEAVRKMFNSRPVVK